MPATDPTPHSVRASPTVMSCSFTGNYAFRWGGAISIRSECSATILDSTFTDNFVEQDGAAVRVFESDPELRGCTFTTNIAGGGNFLGRGAGVFSENGVQGRGAVLDVADAHSVGRLFEELQAQDRLPSVVVNNAGITRDGLLARMSEDDWNSVLETNLGSLYRVCKACARHLMKARRGRIINISSVVG